MIDRYTIRYATIDVSDDDDLSNAVELLGFQVVAVIMPAAWTAADIRFQVNPGDGTFRDVYDAQGVQLSLPVAASRHVLLAASEPTANVPGGTPIISGQQVKLSASAGQAADRTIGLIIQRLPC